MPFAVGLSRVIFLRFRSYSYAFACGGSPLVGSNGLEPSTSRLSGVRSNHLSYEPISVAVRLPSGQTWFASVYRLLPTCPLSPLSRLLKATRERRFAAGGDEQNRTVDPLLARQVLSQLSYAPIFTGLLTGESTLFEGFLPPQIGGEGPQN